MTDLVVIVPTRGRPESAVRLSRAFEETTTSGALPVFVVDEDDPRLPDYKDCLSEKLIPRLMIWDGSVGGKGLCFPLNYAARRYADLMDYVGFMGDDHLPRTLGWDTEMIGELDSMEPRVAYGNDLLQGANLPTAVFLPSRIIKATGVMAPQAMRHLYLDNYWKELGQRLGGLRYRDDVVIEHLHPVAGKAEWDEGYRRVNAFEMDTHDREAWLSFLGDGRMDGLLREVRKEYGDDA